MNRATQALLAASALLVAPACGKKGPPLAPIVRIPAAVEQISARRVGDDVYVSVTVPARNVDTSTPADVEQILVYGFTGRAAPPRPRWAELGTLIATIPVQPPPPTDADEPSGSDTNAPPAPPVGAAQGTSVTVLDALSPDELVPAIAGTPVPGALPASPAAPGPGAVRRFFTAFAIGPRGRPGPPGATAEVPLSGTPPAPTGVRVSYTERGTTVEWLPVPVPPATSGSSIGPATTTVPTGPAQPPAGVVAPPSAGAPATPADPAQPAAAPAAAAGAQAQASDVTPVTQTPAPPPPLPRYNVYRELAPVAGAVEAPSVAWATPLPTPANAAAIDGTTFADDVEFGRQRCYTVRTVQGSGAAAVESAPSSRVCVIPSDTFPPQPPSAPATVAADGVITLVWEPNAEPDLGGYLVLRGDAGDDTLRPLTPAPIADARYRDGDVVPGRRYVYAVIAVDTRTPVANASAASARVEETAR